MDLAAMKCIPCQIGAPTLTPDEVAAHLKEVNNWVSYDNNTKIKKEFEFKDFTEAIDFIDKVASIALQEDHHPNIYLYDYKHVRIELWTHKINGLHQNDFIVASKIDKL